MTGTNQPGYSANNPLRYLGPNVNLVVTYSRNRIPTGADYRDPNTGKLYPISSLWVISKDPVSGSQGDLYYLSKIVANVAYWSYIETSITNFSLTPNSGGVVSSVGDTIPVLGYNAGTVQTMRTYNDGSGNLLIADQSWQTQYVVDSDTTGGLKGTFSTIQAAITQAASDQAAGEFSLIVIRNNSGMTYTENLSFPDGCRIVLKGLTSTYAGAAITVAIIGSHTFLGNNFIVYDSLSLSSPGTLLGNSLTTELYFQNCLVSGLSGNTGVRSFGSRYEDMAVTGGNKAFYYDQFQGTNTITNSTFSMVGCNEADPFTPVTLTINGTSDGFISQSEGINYAGNTTGDIEIYDCLISTAINLPTANISYGKISVMTGYTLTSLFTSTANIAPNTQGNVLKTIATATSYNVLTTDYYIGVTSTASARTITLPDVANVVDGQTFYVKDESGGAAANNITVDSVAGNIDGAASKAIASNYGSLQIIKRASNYFTI